MYPQGRGHAVVQAGVEGRESGVENRTGLQRGKPG